MPDLAHQSAELIKRIQLTEKDPESQRQQEIKETLITGLRYQTLELERHRRYFCADKNLR